MPTAAYLCDVTGSFLEFNQAAVELWGETPTLHSTDHRFCGAFRLYTPDGVLIDRSDCLLAQVLRTGLPQSGEIVMERRDGNRRYVLANAGPIFDDAGNLSGAFNILTDITSRAWAERERQSSEQRFELFMQHLPGLAWIKDLQGRYVYANQAATKVFQTPREQLYGKTDNDLFEPTVAKQFQENDRQAVASPSGLKTIEALQHEDGLIHYSIVHKFPLPGADGNTLLVGGIAIDISEQQQIQETIRKTNAFREAIIQTAAEGICVCFPVPEHPFIRFSVWNERMHEITGYTLEEINRLSFKETMFPDPEIREKAVERIARMFAGDDLHGQEGEITRKDGERRMLAVSTSRIELEDGRTAVVGLLQDITERKRNEESLQMLRFCIDHAGDAAFRVDRQGRILYANQNACIRRGYLREELQSMTIFDLDPDYQPGVWEPHFEELKRQRTMTFETRHRTKSGEVFPVEVNANYARIGDQEMNFAFARDITERKQVEMHLRQNEERFRMLFESANDAIFWVNAQSGVITNCNPAAEKLADRPRCEIVGQMHFCLHPPEHEDHYKRLFEKHATSESSIPVEAEIVRPNGCRISVSISRSVTVVGNQKIVQGIYRDITERKRAEEALRISREQLQQLFDLSPLPNMLYSQQDGRMVAVNNQFLEVFGTQRENVLGRTTTELGLWCDPTDAEKLATFVTQDEVVREFPARLCSPNGQVFEMLLFAQLIELPMGLVVLVQANDVTDRKRAEAERLQWEAQLRHAQKLESLGVLAGGIAHDFNNLLTVMLGYTNLAQSQLTASSPASPLLEEIEKSALRAADLTKQLLAYAGKGKFVIEPLRLDLLVEDMYNLLQTAINKKASVDLQLEPAAIEGDPAQIRQVLMNLITNASDALQNQVGSVRLHTGVRHLTETDLQSPYVANDLPAGEYAFVTVEDTGCGMDAETLGKIFDPFFTTKFTGRGLGLAAVLGIVRSHQGSIRVFSEPNQGTRFEVYIPRSADPQRVAAAIYHSLQMLGKGAILVVEDEMQICDLIRNVLTKSGFAVHIAADGQLGLEAFQRYRSEIVALILDLMMPHMDGLELLRRIREIDPSIPVLIISGFSEDQPSQTLNEAGANGFIQKPFSTQELVSCINRLLSEPDGTGDL